MSEKKVSKDRVKIRIDNNYYDGHECWGTYYVPDLVSRQAAEGWWEDYVFPKTGCRCRRGGKRDSGAIYRAVILESRKPSLVGLSKEWG